MARLSYRSWFSLAAGLGFLIAARSAMASFIFADYVVPTAVELVPTDTTATRVVIHGAFFQLTGATNPTYGAPRCGVMYFECVAGQEAMCRMQWLEVRNAIATAKTSCWGFGSQNIASMATIRNEGAPLGAPDKWDLGMGTMGGIYVDGKCPMAQALVCPLASAPDGGAATDAAASTDAPAMEAAGPAPEAGTSTDAPATGTDAQADDHPTTTIPDAGAGTDAKVKLAAKSGGCAVAGGSTGSAPLALMSTLAGLLLLGRARARRRRP